MMQIWINTKLKLEYHYDFGFKRKLIKLIKDVNGKFDDCSISPKIRQILLHWGFELTEKYFY